MRINRLLFAALLSLFVISPLPLGSNRGWALLALSGLIFLLLATYLLWWLVQTVYFKQSAPKFRIDPAAYLILCVAVWLFVQSLIKLPLDWLKIIAPVTAELYSSAFESLYLQSPPAAVTISLNAAMTLDRGLLSLACFSLLILMGQLINSRKRLVIFCYTLVLSGVFQAIYGVMMTLTGVEYLFLTPKTSYFGNATGTFVNRNHLAGYLEMTLAVGIGLLLSLRKQSSATNLHWRGIMRKVLQVMLSEIAILRGLLIVMVVGLLMTHSRMGNAAFFNALLITGGLALLANKKFRKPGFYAILISIVLVDIFLLGSLFDLEKVVDRMENTGLNTETRDEVVQYALEMVPDFGWLGSGASAFAYVFPGYAKEYLGGFYDFAHNDYLQIFLELGVIGSLLLVIFTLWAVIRGWFAIREERSAITRGMGFAVIMSSISLGIHSAVDFNLQIPANIMLFVAVLGLPWIVRRISKQPLANA